MNRDGDGDTQLTIRAPFDDDDDDDADFTLNSSDNVSFRVYKVIVAKCSSVIKTMTRDTLVPKGRNPSLSENSATIDTILRLCYPRLEVEVMGLNALSDVVRSCRKYEMEGTMKRAACFFDNFVEKPLCTYAIAWQARLEPELRKAAYRCLYSPTSSIFFSRDRELQALPLAACQDLLQYHWSCAQAAAGVMQSGFAMGRP